MKKILLSALIIFGVSALVNAQETDEFSIPVTFTGQRPVISDFVSAILSQEEDLGESLGEMADVWQLYKAGKPLPEGRSFVVDTKNGYFRYDCSDKDEDGNVYSTFIEFCYWNCSNGLRKLVAENTVCFQNGKPFMGQYSGLSFLMYDNKTRKLNLVYDDLGLDFDYPDGIEVITHKLPQTGKTMEYHFHTSSGEVIKKLTWNGINFVENAE